MRCQRGAARAVLLCCSTARDFDIAGNLHACVKPPCLRTPACSYTTFYLTRGSLTYTAPLLVADPALGLDIKAIGAMTSIFPMVRSC
jgi:hypothetical protein